MGITYHVAEMRGKDMKASLALFGVTAFGVILWTGYEFAQANSKSGLSMEPDSKGVAFRCLEIRFGPDKKWIHEATASAFFTRPVAHAQAAISGFNMEFSDGEHEFQRATIDIKKVKIRRNSVEVKTRIGLKGSTGNAGNESCGWLKILLIVQFKKQSG